MRNNDLIAYLEPTSHQFSTSTSVEFIDVTGQVTDIRANTYRLAVRLNLSAGLYRGRFETTPRAFDMSTAMIDMVRVDPRTALRKFFPPAAQGEAPNLPVGIKILSSLFLPPETDRPQSGVTKAVAGAMMRMLGIK